jgi:CRISPR-associated protein Cas6/Cse3/CasE subtype I-E
MYLSKLTLNRSRQALLWSAQPYRIHQRLRLASPDDPRLLFRLEESGAERFLLSRRRPGQIGWRRFGDLNVLAGPPLCKPFDWAPQAGQMLTFRLLANPTARKRLGDGSKKRVGLTDELEQLAWLRARRSRAALPCYAARPETGQDPGGAARPQESDRASGVQLLGVLQVRDAEAWPTLWSPVSAAPRGWAFGLLLWRPVAESQRGRAVRARPASR